jgi:hypothetical protein
MVRHRHREICSMHALPRRLAILASLAIGPVALAQTPGDLIDQTRRMQAVAAQQVEADIRTGLSEAARLTDKVETLNRYKVLLGRTEADKNLPDDRRAALKRVLQDRIRLAETAVTQSKDVAPAAKGRTQFAEGSPAKAGEAVPSDTATIKDGIAKVSALNAQGKQADAQRASAELLKKYPDSVAVQVLNGVSVTAASIDAADKLRIDTEQRSVVAMRDVQKSFMPPKGDLEFGPGWRELSDARLKRYGLSAENKAMMETLAAPIKVELKGVRLQDAMDYMSNQMKRTIIIDKNALEEGQITYETPVSCSFKTEVATRTALRAILNDVHLTYVIRDGVIHVTNTSRAKDLMITRTYYIGDLVTGLGMVTSPPQMGHPQDQVLLAQNVQVIIDMITQSVDPSSWQSRGGMGVIGYNIPTQSLIIRQTAEVQNLIQNSLRH